MEKGGWGKPDFEREQKTEITVERLNDGDFSLADLESLPKTTWQQEPWRNALRNAWLNMARYRNGGAKTMWIRC